MLQMNKELSISIFKPNALTISVLLLDLCPCVCDLIWWPRDYTFGQMTFINNQTAEISVFVNIVINITFYFAIVVTCNHHTAFDSLNNRRKMPISHKVRPSTASVVDYHIFGQFRSHRPTTLTCIGQFSLNIWFEARHCLVMSAAVVWKWKRRFFKNGFGIRYRR